jgi:hypothetical protein
MERLEEEARKTIFLKAARRAGGEEGILGRREYQREVARDLKSAVSPMWEGMRLKARFSGGAVGMNESEMGR